MIKNVTTAYGILILIFGVVLIIGSIKTIIYPDEAVYAPGKMVTLYHPDTKQFYDLKPATKNVLAQTTHAIDFKQFQASLFDNQYTIDTICPR